MCECLPPPPPGPSASSPHAAIPAKQGPPPPSPPPVATAVPASSRSPGPSSPPLPPQPPPSPTCPAAGPVTLLGCEPSEFGSPSMVWSSRAPQVHRVVLILLEMCGGEIDAKMRRIGLLVVLLAWGSATAWLTGSIHYHGQRLLWPVAGGGVSRRFSNE